LSEHALLSFEVELMLVEDVKDPFYNGVAVLLGLAAEDEDVVHHCLEHHQAVSEAKEHDQRFEQALVHLKAAFHSSPS